MYRPETLLGCNLDKFAEDIEELTDGADKQEAIEAKMKEIDERWAGESFYFKTGKLDAFLCCERLELS